LTKTKPAVSVLLIITCVVVISVAFHVHATSPPLIAANGPTSPCLGIRVQFTVTVTASNLTNVQSWQLNMTFDPQQARLMSYSVNSLFTGQNTFGAVNNSTSYFLYGLSLYNGHSPVTTTSQTTLITFTFKTLVYHGSDYFHIVTSTENTQLGTMLLDPNQNSQSYTTSDGYTGCQQRPSP